MSNSWAQEKAPNPGLPAPQDHGGKRKQEELLRRKNTAGKGKIREEKPEQ